MNMSVGGKWDVKRLKGDLWKEEEEVTIIVHSFRCKASHVAFWWPYIFLYYIWSFVSSILMLLLLRVCFGPPHMIKQNKKTRKLEYEK